MRYSELYWIGGRKSSKKNSRGTTRYRPLGISQEPGGIMIDETHKLFNLNLMWRGPLPDDMRFERIRGIIAKELRKHEANEI